MFQELSTRHIVGHEPCNLTSEPRRPHGIRLAIVSLSYKCSIWGNLFTFVAPCLGAYAAAPYSVTNLAVYGREFNKGRPRSLKYLLPSPITPVGKRLGGTQCRREPCSFMMGLASCPYLAFDLMSMHIFDAARMSAV